MNLEHSRFKDEFEYDFEVDEALENADFELPPMMVQPYLENAIWHGLRYRDGLGKLSIHFEKAQDALQIKISDNGIGIEKSKALKTKQQKKQHSLGMKNIATRIALMNEIYGLDIQVQLSETASGSEEPGTTVYLRIPQSRKHNSPSTSSKTKHL